MTAISLMHAAMLAARKRMKFIDALHVATAVHAGRRFFMTKDAGIGSSADLAGLEVVSLPQLPGVGSGAAGTCLAYQETLAICAVLQFLEQGRGNQAEIADRGLHVDPGFPDADDPWEKGGIPRPVELLQQRQPFGAHAMAHPP